MRPDRRGHARLRRSRACSSTPPSTTGTPASNTDRIFASNPCSEYMFLNDSACNLASINLMKFVKATASSTRLLQGGDRTLITAQENHRRQRELPERGNRPEQPRVSSARPGLRQPRRPVDVARPAVRQRRRPRLRGGLTALMTGEGLRAVGAHRPRPRRPVSRATRRTASRSFRVMRKHRDAMRDVKARNVPSDLYQARSLVGRCGGARVSSSATATRRPPCSRRPAPSAS
jgi:ribonucleoside-diphosphate reductase alpha chain